MASFCGYEENVEELKNLLVQTLYALEMAKKQAKEDMRRNEENANQLLCLLKVACQERDEAREQLQKLLSLGTTASDASPVLPTLPPESPIYLTVSDISFGSGASPVDSFLDMVPSPDLSCIDNFGDSSILGVPLPVSSHAVPQECIGDFSDSSNLGLPGLRAVPQECIANFSDSSTLGVPVPALSRAVPQECFGNFSDSSMMGVPEPASSNAVAQEYNSICSSHVIDNLVRGKALPEKGKLLQTVVEAGPLLQTLLVSGNLPQWRNPPPPLPLQTYQMSPFLIKGYDTQSANFKSVANANQSYGSSPISSVHKNHSNKCRPQYAR